MTPSSSAARRSGNIGAARRKAHIHNQGLYTSADLCRLTGASYRQVDYWTRLHLLHRANPDEEGPGTTRAYPAGELTICRVLGALTAGGIEGDVLRAASRAIRRGEPVAHADGWQILIDPTEVVLDRAPVTLIIRTQEGGPADAGAIRGLRPQGAARPPGGMEPRPQPPARPAARHGQRGRAHDDVSLAAGGEGHL